MQYNVSKLLQEPTGSARCYEILEPSIVAGNELSLGELTGTLKLTRTDLGIWANARISTAVMSQCGRCLGQFMEPLEIELNEQFYPRFGEGMHGGLDRMLANENAFAVDQNNLIDLAEPIRQDVVSRMPMKPLCSEECAGICPSCGEQLNASSCDCIGPLNRGPWAELEELRI